MHYLSPADVIAAIKSTAQDVLILDNSALNLFNTCPRKFYYNHVLGIVSGGRNPAIDRGVAMHDALYDYYMTDDLAEAEQKAKETLVKRCHEFGLDMRVTAESKHFSAQWGVHILEEYFRNRGRDVDQLFETLRDGNGRPYLECGFALDVGAGIFVGKFDRLVRERATGDIYLEDHKTTNRVLNSWFWADFHNNNQITSYWLAVQELLGIEIKGFIINGIRTKVFERVSEEALPSKIFVRQIYHRSKDQLTSRLRQIQSQFNTIRFLLSLDARDAFWMNAPNGCSSWGGRCSYDPLCAAPNDKIVNAVVAGGFERKSWEPYEELKQAKIVLAQDGVLAGA